MNTQFSNDRPFVLDQALFEQLLTRIRSCNFSDVKNIVCDIWPLSHRQLFINARIGGTDTALICACRRADLPVIRFLLSEGADPNQKNSAEETPLVIACHQGFYDTAYMLLEYGAQLPLPEKGKIPVQYFYNDSIIQLLLEMGQPLNIEIPCDMEAVTVSYLEIWNEVTYPASQLRFQHMPSGNVRGLNMLLNNGAEISFFYSQNRNDKREMNASSQEFYLQDLMYYSSRFGLVQVFVLCFARDNGDRSYKLNSMHCEDVAVTGSPLRNSYCDMLLETYHPTIILLLLGYPIFETVDLLSRCFGEVLPQKYFQKDDERKEESSGDLYYYRKYRRQKRLQDDGMTQWTDAIVFEILQQLAPVSLAMDLETMDKEGNTVLMGLINRRPSFYQQSRKYATMNGTELRRYVRTRDCGRRCQRYYLFAVHLLLNFGVNVHHRNCKGQSVLDILMTTSHHPNKFFDNYRGDDHELQLLIQQPIFMTAGNQAHATAVTPLLISPPTTIVVIEEREFRYRVMRWCHSFLYSNEVPDCLAAMLKSSGSGLENHLGFSLQNWCSASWPQTLCTLVPEVWEFDSSTTTPTLSSTQLVEQCISLELSHLLMECILFHVLYYATFEQKSGKQDKKAAQENDGIMSALWMRMRRQWWLWTTRL
jgi:hypothetical protein